MSMKQLQEFIKTQGFSALTEQYGIVVKRYDNGICVLNYNQISSPQNHPITNVCRGLTLLDCGDGKTEVLSRSFDRFPNYGQWDTKDFDFSNCTVMEKADGSLVKVWWNKVDNCWEISTRGMAFAEADHCFSLVGQQEGGTFRDWILKAMRFTEEEFQIAMLSFPHEVTYVGEYVGPSNRIVTPYKDDHMVLLAVVGHDGIEESPTLHHKFLCDVGMNVRLPEVYNASSAQEIVDLCASLTDLKEGFVVYDHNTGNRVKVKNAAYVAAHHLRGNGTPSMNAIMELILIGEDEEFLTYFPEYKIYFDPIAVSLECMLKTVEIVYQEFQHLESQKDFALAVKGYDVSPICFRARKEKTSATHAFNSMELNQKVKLLEKYL